MEKLELTPVELMKALGWGKSKTYYWIKNGKFETVQKLEGEKVVISREDLERLKKNNVAENSEKFEIVLESPKKVEIVQENSSPNVTKNYNNVQKEVLNIPNPDDFALFNKSLETIERIHQSALTNYHYTTKLLTDRNSETVQENLELKAEVKTVQARLEKSQKIHFWKNLIIGGLAVVLICLSLILIFVLIGTNNFQKSSNFDNLNSSEQVEIVQTTVPTQKMPNKK